MSNTGLVIGAGVASVVVITTGYTIGTYNTFVTAQQDVKTMWSNIKTEYQRRADLILNLVKVVKSYKAFEKDTMVLVTKARGGDFGKGFAKEAETMNQLEDFFKKFMAVAEAYPTLKSNEQHNKLMEELSNTENRINIARTDYNNTVRDYEILRKEFPSSIVGAVFRFGQEEFFNNEAGTEKAVSVDL